MEHEYLVEVAARRVVADGVVELELSIVAGPAAVWTPGAHIDVELNPGLVRQYSLCGDPAAGSRLRIAVLRERQGRGGSAWIHDRVRVGDRLRVRGPRNHFPLVMAQDYLLIAGGIGITPLLPMIRAVAQIGASWRLEYGGRTRASMAYADCFPPGDVRLHPEDEEGLLDLDAILAAVDDSTMVYCCGPEGLLRAVGERCASRPPEMLRVESFKPRELAARVDTGVRVACAISAVVVDVPPEQSILHALQAAGVPVSSSCQEGTCGTCETVVLEGVPEHRDSVLTAAEREANDVMMICCSRARTPHLTLQI